MMKIFRFLFSEKTEFDIEVSVVAVVSTLLLLTDYYFVLTPNHQYDRILLYFVVPLVVILYFRKRVSEYGFQLGDWKAGVLITLVAVLLMTPVLWFLVRGDATTQAYYAPLVSQSNGLILFTFLDLFGWEFLFRGWMLFGYARRFGANAIWLQAVPFALAHVSKPAVETFSTIFGGFIFGWIAWRTRSFLYPFLIHWYIFTLIILFAGGQFG